MIADLYTSAAEQPRLRYLSWPDGAHVGQVPCHECCGTGWWGYGPTPAECGPCIVCKGTGREWVSLQ